MQSDGISLDTGTADCPNVIDMLCILELSRPASLLRMSARCQAVSSLHLTYVSEQGLLMLGVHVYDPNSTSQLLARLRLGSYRDCLDIGFVKVRR